jgi:hypothetical protein
MTLAMRRKLARGSFEEKIRKVEALLRLASELKRARLRNRMGQPRKSIGTGNR